jgi:hypothetical protein
VTIDRAAAFVRNRLWIALAAGLFTWLSWIVSLALGALTISGEANRTDGGVTFHLSGSLGPPIWERDVLGQIVSPDHLAFYSAARLIREDRPRDIYDHGRLERYQQDELFAPGVWQSFEAFRNPPFYALLYYPTALWPFAASAWFWNAVYLALLWVSVRWLVQSPPTAVGGLSTARAYLWTLSFYPVFAAISFGQNTLLSLFAFAAAYRLLAAGRPLAAGLAAGLLAFKPPLLLGLVVWGLLDVRRLWPCAVGVVVTGAVLVLGSYPLVPAAWDGFVGTLKGNVAFDNFEQFKMHNPVAFWRLLLPGVGDRWHWRLAVLCSAAAGWENETQ